MLRLLSIHKGYFGYAERSLRLAHTDLYLGRALPGFSEWLECQDDWAEALTL